MKQILIILGLFASVTTFAQSPRIKLNQITKDTVKGSVLISSPTDSGMVYSRDFYVAYGADTVLILYGDTILGGGGLSSVLSDGVTITGNGTSGNELKVDTLLIATIKALNDSLATISASTTPDGVTITGDGSVANPLKVDTFLISTIKGLVDTLSARGYLTANQTITLSGDVTGSGTTAITATVVDDSHNHIISNVDFLQDSLNAKANDSDLANYVTLNGTDTITGAKTFTSDLNVDAKIALNAGDDNVVIGDGAGASLVSGQAIGNILVGTQAGVAITTGDYNVANGYQALFSDTIGGNNVANGYQALYSNTSGSSNVANGHEALRSNTSGNNNVANGYQALFLNTTGNTNVANGTNALRSNTSGGSNVANGHEALRSNTSGGNNIANGYQALYSNTSGGDNIANGLYALYFNKTGGNNIANGTFALTSLNSGSNNQAYGVNAGRYLSNGSTALTTASGSLFLGNNTKASANGNSNEIVIGTDAIGNGSNTITIGSSSTQSLHTRNYEFDIDQTVSASEDNYVLTYDSLDGQISLEPISLSGSATLDFGSTSSLNSSDLTITVTGAADGDVVSLGVPNASVNANTNYTAWVSAANTVTVRFNNYSLGAVDPASGTFKVKVFK